MASDLSHLMTPAEVSLAVSKIIGSTCKIIDFQVEKATSSVQGMMSNILRVTAKIETPKGQVHESVRFIIKRFPTLPTQQKLVHDLGLFDQEIGFFEQCLPILLKQCPDLPVVRCYYSNLDEKIICMEDLTDINYIALVESMADLKYDVMSLDHFRVIMEALAKFHSASIGTNWLKQFPSMFELRNKNVKNSVSAFGNIMLQSIITTIIPIAEMSHSGDGELLKNIRWLASNEFFASVAAQSAEDPSTNNVLCHGDCWANNMMFKIDPETNKPIDVKIIDFQLCRYAPQCKDLMNCINMCASVNFRKQHEEDILKYYFDAFNKSCCNLNKHDSLITWDELNRNFNRMRIYGLITTVAFRPMIFLKGIFPESDGGITEDQFKQFMQGGTGITESIKAYQENEEFHVEMNNIIDEAHTLLKFRRCNTP